MRLTVCWIKIAQNEGFGAVLASTPEAAAEKLGDNIEPVLNIKGTPVGETNIMNFRARAMGAAVNPRGSDEYRARAGSFDNLGTGAGTGTDRHGQPGQLGIQDGHGHRREGPGRKKAPRGRECHDHAV